MTLKTVELKCLGAGGDSMFFLTLPFELSKSSFPFHPPSLLVSSASVCVTATLFLKTIEVQYFGGKGYGSRTGLKMDLHKVQKVYISYTCQEVARGLLLNSERYSHCIYFSLWVMGLAVDSPKPVRDDS